MILRLPLVSTLMVVFSVIVAMTPVARAQKNIGGLSSDLASEKVIHTFYDGFTAAWNKHEAEKLGNMWALDGDHIEPDGRVAKGRDGVTKLLKAQHETVFKQTQLKLTIESVWFITGDVALVDGAYEITGIRAPDGTEVAKRAGHQTSILLKENDRWWIAASRLMIPAPLPWRKE